MKSPWGDGDAIETMEAKEFMERIHPTVDEFLKMMQNFSEKHDLHGPLSLLVAAIAMSQLRDDDFETFFETLIICRSITKPDEELSKVVENVITLKRQLDEAV